MISSFDYYKKIESPNMYLCNPDKRPICALNAENRHLVLRFNDLSDLTFTVSKIEGAEESYDLVESKRLIFVEKIGWFQIETAHETIEGDACTKEVTARSHQYALKNRGFIAEERVYMFYNPNDPLDEKYDSGNVAAMPSVIGQLYQQAGIQVALSPTDIQPTEDKIEWTIIYIDPVLKFKALSYGAMYQSANGYDNVCRSFEANDSLNGYDFIINKVEKAFEVIFEFDFLYHTIKVKTLDAITQPTDIYLSFDNIMNSLAIKENAEDIVTVMSCNGGNLDIRTVNPMGTNYIVDFEYYKKRQSDDGKIDYPWMSKELIDALDEWEQEFENYQNSYASLVLYLQSLYTKKAEIDDLIRASNLKLTDMQVARDQYINKEDEDIDGAGTITGETVVAGSTSIKPQTSFYSTAFTGGSVIVGHVNMPNMTKDTNGVYTFSFADSGTQGAADALIQNYYDEESGFDGVEVPLYFMDGDNRSYCKLNIDTIVEIAKDADGNPVSFIHKTGDSWASKHGYITIDDIQFMIYKESAVDAYTISCGSFSLRFTSNSYFVYNGVRYRVVASADGIVSLYRYYVAGFDRFTTYKETAGVGGWCDLWENYITNTLVAELNATNVNIDGITQQMEYISELCNIQKFIKRKGDELYNELSNYWIEGEYTNDNIATHDSTTMAERIDLAKELMAAGRVDLSKSAQPKFEMSVDAINFIKMYEFRQFTNELALGKTITIEKTDGVHYRPALMSLEYDLDIAGSFSMTFSNASKPGDTAMTFADLIKESSSTSRTVSANWSNLTDYSRNKEQITRLIEYPLDRALRAMKASLASQSFIIDESGILGRKYDQEFDGANGTFSPEQIRIINNTIVFTRDNWETAATALGKTEYGYGLVAEVLVGELILGEKISIGSNSERVRIDDSGLLIKNDKGEPVFEADANGDVTLRGTIYATAGEFSGTIRAERGEIGGYVIGEDTLIGNKVGMRSNQSSAQLMSAHTQDIIAFWAGNDLPPEAPFYVTSNGELHSTSGEIGGLILSSNGISSSNRNFNVTSAGELSAISAHIEGDITTDSDTASTIKNLNSKNLTAENVSITQKISISDMEIKHGEVACGTNGVYINFNAGSAAENVEAQLSKNGRVITLSCNKTLTATKTFTVYYVCNTWYGWSTHSCSITVYAGSSSNSYTTSEGTGLYKIGFNSNLNHNNDRPEVKNTTFTQMSSQSKNIQTNGNLYPESTSLSLGNNQKYWGEGYIGKIYTIDEMGTISGSDSKIKNSIEDLGDRYSLLFDELRPVTFRYNGGTSGRLHIGLIANEVKEALDKLNISTSDFGAYCSWDNGAGMTSGIRYSELIALIIKEVQSLKASISQLKCE